MAQFGNSTTPASGNWYDQVASNRQFWNTTSYNCPGGIATDMYIYVGGYGMTASASFCIWDSGGTLVWSSASGGIGNGETWVHFSVPNVYLAPGNYYLGFYAANGQNVQWQFEAAGSGGVDGRSGLSGPSAATGGGDEYGGKGYGAMGVYVVYTPGDVHVWNGSAWVDAGEPEAYGTSWSAAQPEVYDGTNWNIGQ